MILQNDNWHSLESQNQQYQLELWIYFSKGDHNKTKHLHNSARETGEPISNWRWICKILESNCFSNVLNKYIDVYCRQNSNYTVLICVEVCNISCYSCLFCFKIQRSIINLIQCHDRGSCVLHTSHMTLYVFCFN